MVRLFLINYFNLQFLEDVCLVKVSKLFIFTKTNLHVGKQKDMWAHMREPDICVNREQDHMQHADVSEANFYMIYSILY